MPNPLIEQLRAQDPERYRGMSDAEIERLLALGTPADVGIGALKGAGRTVLGLGELVSSGARHIPGLRDYVATPEQFEALRQEYTTPTNLPNRAKTRL